MSADNPLLCLLFVPGNRPERFAKALAAGADAICIDLEAAVPDADKDSARDCVLAFLRERAGDTGDCRVMVRLNPLTGQTGQADLEAFASQQQALPDFVMTTLTESAAETRRVHDSLAGQCATFALIESVQGLRNAADIAACEGVAGLMLGGADLSAQLRAKMNFNTLLVPRSQLVFAAAPEDIEVVDVPWLDMADEPGLIAETENVRDLGFTGKAAIHPKQVAAIRQAFRPTAEEVAHAKRVLQADAEAGGGVVTVDGQMVDAPVVAAMRRILTCEASFAGG